MKTNICSFYRDGLIQVHQRGGDVGKTYKQKSYKPAKGSCLQVAMDVPQSREPSQTSYWLGIRFAFFVWLMWKTVYLGKSVAPRLSCNANSNPFLAASLTPNQSHKPGNFKMIFMIIYIIQCCKLDTIGLKYTDAQSTKQIAFWSTFRLFNFNFPRLWNCELS